jgi:hypothetical protein
LIPPGVEVGIAAGAAASAAGLAVASAAGVAVFGLDTAEQPANRAANTSRIKRIRVVLPFTVFQASAGGFLAAYFAVVGLAPEVNGARRIPTFKVRDVVGFLEGGDAAITFANVHGLSFGL